MDLQNEIRNFQRGAKIKNTQQQIDEKLVKWAIDKGYADAKRTFKGIGACSEEKAKAFENLKRKLLCFFTNKCPTGWDDYMQIHEQWCDEFINDLKPFSASYGQAQKVINMAMKYIFCSTNQKSNFFEFCHMALDSYILAWYNRQKIGKTNTSWSSLTKDEYKEIQCKIYKFLKDGNGKYYKRKFGKRKLSLEFIPLDCAPIKAEFVIWSCEINYPNLASTYITIKEIQAKNIDVSMLEGTDEKELLNLIKQ